MQNKIIIIEATPDELAGLKRDYIVVWYVELGDKLQAGLLC